MMGCAIFYKKCQEVDTVATQILIGAPNTMEEEINKQTMDKKLKVLEKKLLLTDKNYQLMREQFKNWVKYAVVREFPMGMPWEGTEEKKQKQGTNNARLTYILRVYQPNCKQMKTLLAYAKEKNVWHKHWGNTAFTIKLPEERSSQEAKTKYIQMVQIHSSVQLSMGAASIEGMIDIDTNFDLRLLPGVDRKQRPPTKTSVKEIFSMMEHNGKKVWICLSTGMNGMSTGYFSSLWWRLSSCAQLSKYTGGFAIGAVSWIMEDVNKLIQHCFTLSQQQKVTKSKYIKEEGHAMIDQMRTTSLMHRQPK
jgi:hypothetical protein